MELVWIRGIVKIELDDDGRDSFRVDVQVFHSGSEDDEVRYRKVIIRWNTLTKGKETRSPWSVRTSNDSPRL